MKFNGDRIVDLRWEKRLKQKDLATAMGVGSSLICFWEKGMRAPSSVMLMRLSKALDVQPEYFFSEQ